MDIIGNRLMASTIEEVIENPQKQTITFNLMFPYDFGNNLFEERYLKFNKVVLSGRRNNHPFRSNSTNMEYK